MDCGGTKRNGKVTEKKEKELLSTEWLSCLWPNEQSLTHSFSLNKV